jgi:hypothetical protein
MGREHMAGSQVTGGFVPALLLTYSMAVGCSPNFLSIKGCVTSRTPCFQVYDSILIEAKREGMSLLLIGFTGKSCKLMVSKILI